MLLGTYGIVYKARHRQTNRIFAVKKIRTEEDPDGISATALRELVFLRELEHPNILKLVYLLYSISFCAQFRLSS